jgi:hypothetical protein
VAAVTDLAPQNMIQAEWVRQRAGCSLATASEDSLSPVTETDSFPASGVDGTNRPYSVPDLADDTSIGGRAVEDTRPPQILDFVSASVTLSLYIWVELR